MTDKTEKPAELTRQGPNAAGPGDAHGVPLDDAPGPWGTGERRFYPEGGKPAHDPDKAAAELLARANPDPRAEGEAGPEPPVSDELSRV